MEENEHKIPDGWISEDFGNLISEKRKSKLKVSDATNFGLYPFFTSGEAILLHNEKQIDGENIFLATGGVANVKYFKGDVAYSTDTYAISTKDIIKTKFLFYYSQNIISYINLNYFQGSGLKHLQKKDIKKHKVYFPKTVKEQSKIAEILSKVDKAISETEIIIAKYNRIKIGLMQDLLTKGIDEKGKIRSEETHEFKVSALGRIPKEWDVVSVENLCEDNFVGIVIKPTQYYIEYGVPMLRSLNVKEGYIKMQDFVFMSHFDNLRMSKTMLRENDVVSVRTGNPGISSIITKEQEGFNCIDLVVSRTNIEMLIPEFLVLWLNSSLSKRQILNHKNGVAQQHFNVGQMKKLKIFKISIDEQNRILNSIKAIDQNLQTKELEKRKLQAIKTGLMQDLLSGNKRVTHLLN